MEEVPCVVESAKRLCLRRSWDRSGRGTARGVKQTTMTRHAAAIKQVNPDVESREAVDPAVYEGWDFDQLNREARELRRIAQAEGYDAALSSSRGRAAAVVPRRSA
jgi:hypothetical protein